MKTARAMKWYLRACPVCGGDLHDDLEQPGWVVCFMCARSFRVTEAHTDVTPERPERVTAAVAPSKAA